MKKILSFSLLLIIIPLIMIYIVKVKEKNKIYYYSNMIVRVKRSKTGNIETIPLEKYVAGVLAGEMPLSFSDEALKAQAVAARTYVMKRMEYNKNLDYDVVDTVQNQVYLDDEYLRNSWKENYKNKKDRILEIINSTYGEYLEYEGRIVDAFFFSTSTGITENSEDIFSSYVPYLRSVDSSWDEETSSVFHDVYTMSTSDFYSKLNIQYSDKLNYEIINSTPGGKIKEIMINNHLFDGNDVKNKLEIRSSDFTLEQIGNNIIIKTVGFGHGVGMSQYGAEAMARRGYSYDEILKYYYTGVSLKKL